MRSNERTMRVETDQKGLECLQVCRVRSSENVREAKEEEVSERPQVGMRRTRLSYKLPFRELRVEHRKEGDVGGRGGETTTVVGNTAMRRAAAGMSPFDAMLYHWDRCL